MTLDIFFAAAFAFLGWQARAFLADARLARASKQHDAEILRLTEFYSGLVFSARPAVKSYPGLDAKIDDCARALRQQDFNDSDSLLARRQISGLSRYERESCHDQNDRLG